MNLFHQGFARESDDGKVIAAAMGKPGVVLQRPVGSDEAFREHADLPTVASLGAPPRRGKARPKKAAALKARQIDEKAERRAAAAFEKQRRRREKQRQKEEAAAAKAHARRKVAMEEAEEALEDAKREHDETAAAIEKIWRRAAQGESGRRALGEIEGVP
jgi:colicin import membrane protein